MTNPPTSEEKINKNPGKITYAMSGRRQKWLIASFVLAAALLILFDHSNLGRNLQRKPKSSEQIKAGDLEKYHAKTFTVINVVDGDTIDIDIPDGEYGRTRIRLWGVDTPETKSTKYGVMYFGPEASEFTGNLTGGKRVCVYLDEGNRTRGKFGRLLAYVQLDDTRFLNEVLLTEGFAYADLRFRHSFYNKYKQLEAVARSRNRGLWQKVTHEQLPQWLQREKPNLILKK